MAKRLAWASSIRTRRNGACSTATKATSMPSHWVSGRSQLPRSIRSNVGPSWGKSNHPGIFITKEAG